MKKLELNGKTLSPDSKEWKALLKKAPLPDFLLPNQKKNAFLKIGAKEWKAAVQEAIASDMKVKILCKNFTRDTKRYCEPRADITKAQAWLMSHYKPSDN